MFKFVSIGNRYGPDMLSSDSFALMSFTLLITTSLMEFYVL